MNYLTEERKHGLASEYVLGTLSGAARIRYQHLLMEQLPLRESLWHWESHLNALGAALPEQKPNPRVWTNIQKRLGFVEIQEQSDDSKSDGSADVLPFKRPAETIDKRWRWLATAASVATVALLTVLLWNQPRVDVSASSVAMIQDQKSQALWLIELTDKELRIQATEHFSPDQNSDYELWIVATDGRPPISLGLLPEQGAITKIRSAMFDQVTVAALAVSREPPGGSPNGLPTEVLYTSQLVTL